MDGVRCPDGNYLADYVPARVKKFRHTVKQLRSLRPSGRTLLDFGAATGDFVAIARDEGLHADGVELSSYAIDVARKRHGIQLHLGGCEAIPRHRYDFIHLHHVFEHLARPAAELSSLVDHLAPGGILYIEIPYQFHMLERLRYRLKQGARQETPTLFSFHHPFFYTPESLRRMLERAGLDVISVRTFVPGHYEANGVTRRIKKAGWWVVDRMFHLGNIIEAVAICPER
jgi:SAM-dependent methyltransferase